MFFETGILVSLLVGKCIQAVVWWLINVRVTEKSLQRKGSSFTFVSFLGFDMNLGPPKDFMARVDIEIDSKGNGEYNCI